MEYRFDSSDDYLDFRDVFYDYFRRRYNPFRLCFDGRFDDRTEKASNAIGNAHFAVFISAFSTLPLTPLAMQELELSKNALIEMNIAVIRHEIETGRNDYCWDTRREVQKHENSFPCSFAYDGERFLSLPEEYESLLDRIVSFYDAVARFDPKDLASFLQARYEGFDVSWAEEHLDFLCLYFVPSEHHLKRQSLLLHYRRQRQ